MERLELPTTPSPDDTPTPAPTPKPKDDGEKTGLDALIPDSDGSGTNTISDGVDPYKPKDKCYFDTFYLHSALSHDFYDYEDVVFTNGTVCYCTGASLCNTGALLVCSKWLVYVAVGGLLAVVMSGLKLC
jgi:hypothetical protein